MINFQKINDKEKWKKLLDKVLFKTFFHNLEWENFLEKEYKWLKFERYLYKNEALLSIARYKRKGKEYLVSHPFCEYGGFMPLKDGINTQEFKRDLFKDFKEQIKISFHPYTLNTTRMVLVDEIVERESFFLENIDKTNIDFFWHNIIDRNRRRAITKAEQNEVRVVECRTEKELKELYDFYVQNLKEHRALAYPFSFFKFFLEQQNKRQVKILIAKLGDKNLGGNIFLFYQGIVHSFLCGFDKKRKDLGVHSLVIWEMIKKTKEIGYSVFDFGAAKKNSALESFKQRWGAKCLPIFEIKNYENARKTEDSFSRKAWACLPSCAIKLLSPHFIKRKL